MNSKKPGAGTGKAGKASRLWGLIPLFLFPLLWYVIARAAETPLLPDPLKVLSHIIKNPNWLPHLGASLRRILCGMLLAILAGFPLGIAAGKSRLLSLLCSLGDPIPKVVLLPPLVILLGVGEAPKVLLIFLVLVFPVMVSVRDALNGLPAAWFVSLRSLGVPAYRRFPNLPSFRYMLLPALLPELLSALRVGLGIAVAVLFFTENFGTTLGMGHFIMDARIRVNYPDLYGGILVLALPVLCLFLILDGLEDKFFPWHRRR